MGQIDKILTRTQLEKIQILYVLQFAGISCARSIYFMATIQNSVRTLYLLCGNKRVFCAYCMRFFVFFCSSPHTLIVHAGSLKATKGNSTSVCTFSTAPLELFRQIRFWLDSDVKKPNKQTRRNKDKKKRHNAALHLGKGIFFFFKLRPLPIHLSVPASSGHAPEERWRGVGRGGVGGGWVPQCPWRRVEHLHAPFGAKGGQGHPVPLPATQVGRCICWRRQQRLFLHTAEGDST